MPSCKSIVLSPLLRSKNQGTGVLPGSNSRQHKNKKQFRTAQLHIQRNNINKDQGEERTPIKKEGMLHLLSTPHVRAGNLPARLTARRVLDLPASLTVEAALALPIFLAAMCILIFPLRVLEAQEAAQLEMEKALEIVAVSEGVRSSIQSGQAQQGTGQAGTGQAGTGQAGTEPTGAEPTGAEPTGAEPSGAEPSGADGDVSNLQPSVLFQAFDLALTGKTIITAFDPQVFYAAKLPSFKFPTAEDPMASVQVTGLVRFPFIEIITDETLLDKVTWKLLCPVSLVSSRRAWVGRKGGYGRSYGQETGQAGTGEGEEEDRTVYIARNSAKSGRYHVSGVCHYLDNDLSYMTRAQLDKARNSDGGKYHPCPSCHPQNCDTVYVFKRGSAYHSSPSCKAIGAYVTELKESEARERGLTPCSYCGRAH